MSVHFRVLYLLANFTSTGKIPDTERSLYAKILRGQLSEGELNLLRYNCLAEYGAAMRKFANRMNVLKHLPIMRLLEFRKWSKIVSEQSMNNAIDTELIAIKKKLTIMLDAVSEAKGSHVISLRYVCDFSTTNDHNQINFTIKVNTKHLTGGGVKRPICEKALDKFSEKSFQGFWIDVFKEYFIVSNFGMYNKEGNVQINACPVRKNGNEELFEYTIIEETHLAHAYRQMSPEK